MINSEIDLLIGQLFKTDRVPVNYSSPKGQFKGTGYKNVGGKVEPVYEKYSGQAEDFFDPNTFSYNKIFTDQLREFIYTQQPAHVFPTVVDKDTLVGVGHKLQPIEIANQMIAYRNYEFMPLDDASVQKVIRDNFNQLQRNTKEPFMPLRATDKDSGITVVSFKNGVLTTIINDLYKVDIASAINIVQKHVKVHLNKRQLIAIISLVFEIKGKRLFNSPLLKVLNEGHYNKVPSYFMDFSETVLPDGETRINEEVFNRRLNEAELFSSILHSL